MTREEIQKQALVALKENNYHGTICLSTGTGKSYTAIQAIKEGNFKNILITSPRTNLKENWLRELQKWCEYAPGHRIPYGTTYWFKGSSSDFGVTIENIQTCYKWSLEQIQQFDYIIQDEIHTMATPEYGRLINLAKAANIPVTGLTATSDAHKEEKRLFYETYCPIIYEYYDSAEDGIVNKRRYIIYEYELTDKYQCSVRTKSKSWTEGEKKRYNYIQNTFENSAFFIENYYFKEIKGRVATCLKNLQLKEDEAAFLKELISSDLAHFKNVYWDRIKKKDLEYSFYKTVRHIQGNDYTSLGMKAEYSATKAPDELKPHFYKYIWARNARKEFLWNLTSSANIAARIKYSILHDKNNKVLLFSELTKQAEKLSPYRVHSKQDDEVNKLNLQKFDSGEIRELASCNSLTLGLNIKGANYAIMESFSGSTTGLLQKAGRLDRLAVKDIATIIFIVPKDTQTEQWFKLATKDIDLSEAIYINNLKDFTI